MRPSCAWIWLPVLCGSLWGCATGTGSRTADRLFRKPTPVAVKEKEKETASAKEKSSSTAAADKPSNPFRKTTPGAAAESSPPSHSKTADAKPAKPETPVQTANASDLNQLVKPASVTDAEPLSAFKPETLQLIDAELADATPQERSFWYEQLKRVDPAVIPQILQARRLTEQVVAQQHQESSSAADSPTASDSKTPWAADRPAVVPAVGRQLADENPDVQTALYQADELRTRDQIVQQSHETPAAPPAKSPYAVQRVSGTGPQATAAPPSVLPNNPTARNALSRLLTPRNGAAAASTQNASPVSLLPPTQFDTDASWQTQLDPLISMVEADIAQLRPDDSEAAQTEYIRRHVYLRMLYLMARHPERALTAIPGIEPADQEFWQQTLWAMTNYFDTEHIASSKDRAGQAVAQLTTAIQRLREKADLEIRNLAFCQEIAYFGNFTRLPRDEFRPGDSAQVYAEIENFKSELTVDGQYRTLLRSTVEILSPSGEVRWHKEFPATEDLCVNYRRDYFNNYQFAIPDRLPLGPHSLKLTVFDELSGKMVSQSVKFVVR